MESGLMLCDIGNSALKIGFIAAGGKIQSYSFPTNPHDTPDSLGLRIAGALKHAGVGPIKICVAASVVPALDPVLKEAVRKYLDCRTLFVPEDLPVPLENRYKNRAETGADILVGAYAARKMLPEAKSLIVVDFGTAATFACVSENAFLGGLIFPGPQTAAYALATQTARLPHINPETESSEPAPGLDTATSIRHGLVFGFVAMTEGLCSRLGAQLPKPLKIVATGGFSQTIEKQTTVFDVVLPNLLLDGLAMLYESRAGADSHKK